MIQLALITKNKPKLYLQFVSLLRESDEFDNLIIKDDNTENIFKVFSVYTDEDLKSLKSSKNYQKISDCLYIDKRTLPDYCQDWEIAKLKRILDTYSSIALEDLKSYR